MNSTAKNITWLSIANIFSKMAGTLAALIIAKFLGPENFGVWSIMLLIYAFAGLTHLGTLEAMLKEVPFYAGSSEDFKVKDIEQQTLGSVLLSNASFFIIIALSFLIIRNFYHFSYFILFLLILIAMCISVFSNFYLIRFSSRQKFNEVSTIQMIRSILNLILVAGLAWLWGLTGAVVGILIAETIVCCYSLFRSHLLFNTVRASFHLPSIWKLIVTGFPITFFWLLFMFRGSIDRIITISYLGKEANGLYSLGIFIISSLVLIPDVIGQVLYPQVNESYGKSNSIYDMRKVVLTPIYLLAITMPLFLGITYFLLPFVYITILPKYHLGLKSAGLLVIGSFFVSFVRTGVNFLMATNRGRIFTFAIIISILLSTFGSIVVARSGFYIEGIALITAISNFVLVLLILWRVIKELSIQSEQVWKKLISLHVPFILLIILLYLIPFIMDKLSINKNPFLLSLIFILFYIPYLLSNAQFRSFLANNLYILNFKRSRP